MFFFIDKISKFFCIKESCIALLLLLLCSCSLVNSNDTPTKVDSLSLQPLSSNAIANNVDGNNGFKEWLQQWGVREKGQWGLDNISLIKDSNGRFDKVLRVSYPAGSVSPSYARKKNKPIGGGQFFADLGISPTNTLRLSYYLRFSKDFEFVKGGKLPGLFGGTQVSGGKVPNGTNGFSTRFMWRRNGDGEVYAYLPTSKNYGTSIGRGDWRFVPGKWYYLEQEVKLNKPGINDGRITVWLDGKEVLDEDGLTFRTTENLKIEGIFFSTFFGGSSSSWATPKDVEVDFAEFSLTKATCEKQVVKV